MGAAAPESSTLSLKSGKPWAKTDGAETIKKKMVIMTITLGDVLNFISIYVFKLTQRYR